MPPSPVPSNSGTIWVHPRTTLPVARRLKIVAGRGGMGMLNGETLEVLRVNLKSYTALYDDCFEYRVFPDECEVRP